MRYWCLVLACAGLALPVGARPGPQQGAGSTADPSQGALVTVELRVISAGPGAEVTVDRGGSDALAEGDLVRFHPRDGGVFSGSVTTVNRRSAVITLLNPTLVPEVGTRGEVRIPRARLAENAERRRAAREEREAKRNAQALPAQPPEPEPEAEEDDPYWSNLDQEYADGMPLLAEVGVVRPEEREPRVSGRYYAIADQIITSDDGRKTGFYRVGTSVRYENPGWFGGQRGGEINFDGELNYRNAEVPDPDDEDGSTLRIDRLSYRWGGNRFSPERQEIGRFLQPGMPEFGVLDGYAYSKRTDEGHRFGLSAGFMPEPDEDLESGKDFQLAAWYRWVSDLSERVSATAGFQKSWHNGAADRDLLVGKFHYLPVDGWNVQGTAWLDYYTSGDDLKGSGLGLTQAYLTAHRFLESNFRGKKNTVSFAYSHLEFPDIERYEFVAQGNEIEDMRRDRLSFTHRRWVRDDARLHTSLGVWVDDDDEGLDGDLGYEVVLPKARADISIFGTQGAYSTAFGLRGSYGHYVENGRWDIAYEIANQDNDGFNDNNDDLLQQRFRASREYRSQSGWNVSGYAEANYWETEEGLTLGFYITRSF